ncbi:mucin-associated surface protein [Micrococcaceae bacterium Sec5.7]
MNTVKQIPAQGIRPRRPGTAIAGCILAAVLAGCGATAPDLGSDAATQFQQRVLTVSRAAAGNDPATALKSLDALVADLNAAASSGQVSFKRHQKILGAVIAVRADLTAAKEAARVAAGAAAAAEAARAAAEAKGVPAQAPAEGNNGKNKDGKGKGH